MYRNLPQFVAVAAATLVVMSGCEKTTGMNGGLSAGTSTSDATSESRPAASPSDFSTDPIQANSAMLLVYGMSCPLCATNVDQQLLAVPGVRQVNVDLSNGWVQVSFHPDSVKPSARELASAVVESGMTIVDINTN